MIDPSPAAYAARARLLLDISMRDRLHLVAVRPLLNAVRAYRDAVVEVDGIAAAEAALLDAYTRYDAYCTMMRDILDRTN